LTTGFGNASNANRIGIKANPTTADIPVIFLSALPAPYYTREHQFTPDEYLIKPIDAYELRTRVQQILKAS